MLEMQLRLLEQVAVAPAFRYTPVCVLMNKIDLMPKAMKDNKFSKHWNKFKGNDSKQAEVVQYIGNRAARRVKKSRKKTAGDAKVNTEDMKRQFFPSTTTLEICALDANLVQRGALSSVVTLRDEDLSAPY